ncbi:MAG TPA: Ig-like domain-containing protein [Nocardioides sp.]|nr:Ig-like domain-containing protein [Nocardioides sp.]
MLPAPIDSPLQPGSALPAPQPGTRRRAARDFRRRMAWLSVLATVVATLVGAGTSPALAAQATGDEVPSWSTGWSWTYATVFNYTAEGTNVTINETVTYTVAGVESYQGQPAYKLDLTGTITGGNGTAAVDGVGNATLSNFSGTVNGARYVRRSDFALLKETQSQALKAKAQVSILSANITANIDLSMDPQRGWRLIQFPTEAGDSWINDVDVDYTGGFSYDAGSLGGSGSDTFDGTLMLDGPTTVADETIAVPAGTVGTRRSREQSTDGATRSTLWYSPNHRNAARLLLEIPLDGGSLTLDQRLASASTPAPSTTLTSSITPSLTCGGDDLTIAGKLSSGAAGVPVTIALDKSPVTPGAASTTTATTTAGGNYTATLQAPADSDGYQRTGIRGSWGVVVTAGGAATASTVLVTPRNCSAISYTGDAGAPQGTTANVSATLVDKAGAGVAGLTVTFALSGGATTTATTNAAGVAATALPVAGPPRGATLTASYDGSATLEPASTTAAFTVGAISTSTTVEADPAVVTFGDPVRFHATVAPTHGGDPAGTVRFRVDGSDFGPAVPLTDGEATSPALSTLGLGDHTVVAAYNGTSDHAASTSAAVTFRVREPLKPTTTTSSVDPANAVTGQAVTLGATVAAATGTPTGEVVFTVGSDEVARAAVGPDGAASATVTDLPVGSNAVVATYAGDDVFGPSSASPRTVTVTKAAVAVALTATDSSTVTGEAVGLTATVTAQAPGGGTPDGTVQLLVDGNPVGAPVALTNGSATFAPLTSLSAGSHTLAASYAGSSGYLSGADQVEQEVTKADTTVALVASPSPSLQDQEVRLTATVVAVSPGSGSASGTVTFLAGDDPIGSAPLSGGTATLDVSDLAPGSYLLSARYAGDDDYRASTSAPVSHTVIEGTAVVATSTVLTSSANPSTYGELITFRAQVAAADDSSPAGTVQFSVDGQDFGGPVAVGGDGVAESATLASPDPGDHTVIAAFTPEPGFSGSGDILVQTVASAGVDVALTSSNGSAQVGSPVHFEVEVSSRTAGTGVPTGFVQFSVDGQPLGDAVELEDGAARSIGTDDLAPGAHTVTALYSGDIHFRPELAELAQSVAKIATTTTLNVSSTTVTYGDPLVLVAIVRRSGPGLLGNPTGSVTFLADGVEIGTAPVEQLTGPSDGVSSIARLEVGALPAGTHHLRAVYGGTAVFDGSSSAVVDLTVAKRATTTSADAAVVKLNPLGLPLGQLRATVATSAGPLAGVPVEFRVGSKVVCTSVTNGAGAATCNAGSQLVALVLNGGYTATFLGDANHLSSTARGAILK